MPTCNSCGTSIVWAITRHGKAMPVDAQPHADGNVELKPRGDGQYIATVHGQQPLGAAELHRAHFATCPNADTHRRRREA